MKQASIDQLSGGDIFCQETRAADSAQALTSRDAKPQMNHICTNPLSHSPLPHLPTHPRQAGTPKEICILCPMGDLSRYGVSTTFPYAFVWDLGSSTQHHLCLSAVSSSLITTTTSTTVCTTVSKALQRRFFVPNGVCIVWERCQIYQAGQSESGNDAVLSKERRVNACGEASHQAWAKTEQPQPFVAIYRARTYHMAVFCYQQQHLVQEVRILLCIVSRRVHSALLRSSNRVGVRALFVFFAWIPCGAWGSSTSASGAPHPFCVQYRFVLYLARATIFKYLHPTQQLRTGLNFDDTCAFLYARAAPWVDDMMRTSTHT